MNVDFLISIVIALIMFGIGTSISFEKFKTQLLHPKAVFIGLVLQIIFLPSITLLISSYTNLSTEMKMGIFIVSICPGGATSNFISYILKADVALSVILTVFNSFLILITIPFLLNFGLNFYCLSSIENDLNLTNSIFKLLLMLITPVITGVIVNHKKPQLCKKLSYSTKIITTCLLAIVFGIKFFGNSKIGGSEINYNEIIVLIGPCLMIHLASTVISYLISINMKIKKIKSITISIEVGLQNTALALLISSVLMSNNEMSKPALVFAMFSFFTTLIFTFFVKNLNRTF